MGRSVELRVQTKNYSRWGEWDEDDDDETELDGIGTKNLKNVVDESHSIFTNSSSSQQIINSPQLFNSRVNLEKVTTGRRRKIQVSLITLSIFIIGFSVGLYFGSHSSNSSSIPKKSPISHIYASRTLNELLNLDKNREKSESEIHYSNDVNNTVLNWILKEVDRQSIRHNLRRMSQESHGAGSSEGKLMANAIRDLWRNYGLSVRVETQKALLTKAKRHNYLEVYFENGSIWSSSVGGSHLPSTIPLIAFSPQINYNGTLIYGHYGREEDFELLEKNGIFLKNSIALLRFSSTHIYKIALNAQKFRISALVFYPDPFDFGTEFPGNAVKSDSFLSFSSFHDHQRHRDKIMLPAHTISYDDATVLLRLLKKSEESKNRGEMGLNYKNWTGGLMEFYPFFGNLDVGIRIFNEFKMSSIYNVVGAIPGAWESDRYVILGSSHDSVSYGCGEPGVGLAIGSEIVKSFSNAIKKGWRPRRSLLFISWDAHFQGATGTQHWLQEHHFEIWSRAVAYIDTNRILSGNLSLGISSSPLLKEVAKKAVQKVAQFSQLFSKNEHKYEEESQFLNLSIFSTLSMGQPTLALFSSLGIPSIKFFGTNGPKGRDFSLFNTAFDTFDKFTQDVDPNLSRAETLGRVISSLLFLLIDSPLLPMNVEEFVDEIQKAFTLFISQYQEDFHQSNLSIAYLEAAVMRLEVIGDNFRTEIHNRSVINLEHESEGIINNLTHSSHHTLSNKKLLFHRIINDKLMGLERAFVVPKLSSNEYENQVFGLSPSLNYSFENYESTFPQLRSVLTCRRNRNKRDFCKKSRDELGEEVSILIRCFNAAAAILQSPLLPEENTEESE